METRAVRLALGDKVREKTQSQRDPQPVATGRQAVSPSAAASLPIASKSARSQCSTPSYRPERMRRQELRMNPQLPSASCTHSCREAPRGNLVPPPAEARMLLVAASVHTIAIIGPAGSSVKDVQCGADLFRVPGQKSSSGKCQSHPAPAIDTF